MTQELTTTEIKAKIRLFAWPITLSMLVAQLYSVIDMAVFWAQTNWPQSEMPPTSSWFFWLFPAALRWPLKSSFRS